MDLSKYSHKIFHQKLPDFEPIALEVFRFQYANNPVYHDYVNALGINDATVQSITQIPFLPISFFKTHTIITTSFDPQVAFESSGTTGSTNSRHYIRDTGLYTESFMYGFERMYGPISNWCMIGLLPSYLERKNSSLVYMVNELVKLSAHPQSGFYLEEYDRLFDVIRELEAANQPTILIGVTFALLDFAERYASANGQSLRHVIVMETGGMKGRREEMIRAAVHDLLKKAFGLPAIHSEYGMTELLSQAYSKGDGIFHCPPWMKILIRNDEDPLQVEYRVGSFEPGAGNRDYSAGAINIIDLANIYSCSFIATDDAGKLYADGSFEVLGRIDNSDIRGCSLMVI